MKPAIDWVKANVLVVVLGVVALAAIVAGWFFAGSLNASVREEASKRAGKMTELASLEKSSVKLDIPGREPLSKTVVINQQILDEYREASEKLRSDATQIRELALSRNRRDHKVVADRVFPAPPATERETTPLRVFKALMKAYDGLFAEVNAGSPPANDMVGESLMRREVQYVQSNLKKASRDNLDEREKQELRDELSKSRLAIYGEQAQKLTFYANLGALDLPASPEGKAQPTLAELFDWQWRLWITRDILHAIVDASAAANGGTPGSVLNSPVKRLVWLKIDPPAFPLRAASSTSGPGAGGFGGMSAGGAAGDGSTPPADGAAPPAASPTGELGTPQIDMATEAARDYSKGITGRQSNGVYDVRRVDVNIIAATSQLPLFFDALAKRNFMTVTNVEIRPENAFAAASQGFIFGREPVSNVTLTIETVWLREWTAPLMPAEVRTALGIQAAPAAAPTG